MANFDQFGTFKMTLQYIFFIIVNKSIISNYTLISICQNVLIVMLISLQRL